MKKRQVLASMTGAALLSLTAAMSVFAAEGWNQQSNGQWCYLENDGSKATDAWRKSGDNWFYLDSYGNMVVNQLIDDTYYVNEAGAMITNAWKELPNDDWEGNSTVWYYFTDNGKAAEEGLRTINGQKYYFESSQMQTGWHEVNGKNYYFKDSGAMATGWEYINPINGDDDGWSEPEWYYFSSSGQMSVSREQKINGETYVFDDQGRMLTGWIDNDTYTSSKFGDVSGATDLRYHSEDGTGANGWKYLSSPDNTEDGWYYFYGGRAYNTEYKGKKLNDDYALASISNKTYCFRKDGRMYTGLLELDDGRKFYFDENGVMKTGRVVVNDENHDNEVFYFTASGSLGSKGDGVTGVKNGYLYDDGALVHAEEGTKYQIVEVDGARYMVNEDGKVKTSGTVRDGDGVKYKITKAEGEGYNIEIVPEED
ncbi:MAG: hypothetical protein ACLSX5_01875 [Lachnospiraceae bacterium]